MTARGFLFPLIASGSLIVAASVSASATRPDTIAVESDGFHLRALLYRPMGAGPFPGILFNPGIGYVSGVDENGVPDYGRPEILGPLFAAHGYAFLYLYRRGDGLSRGQGSAVADVLDRAAERGPEERNRTLIQRLQHDDMDDAIAGLAALRARREVDSRRTAIVGHSFGGMLSVLLAGPDTTLRAAVIFSGGTYNWDRSPALRRLLIDAATHSRASMMFIHAANDYSTAPGESLAAVMHRLGKAGEVRIYPAVGHTSDDGHYFIHLGVPTWKRDVFAFLDSRMKR